MKEDLLCAISAKTFSGMKFFIGLFKHGKKPAFSLVEMLMALLVASLLLAALAPVITKRWGNENVVISGTGRNTSEHYMVFDDVSKNGTDDNIFTIPANAINVRISMIGGGGAGGSATFGSKVITASENNWRVPDGVKKIRVYMVGGGGGGASGGIVLANQLGTLNKGYKDYKDEDPENTIPANTGGEFANQKISDLILENKTYLPEIDEKCKNSGYENWESNITSLNTTITGCGAGGAGGPHTGGGSGGSGGYKTQNNIVLQDNYIVRIPGVATTGDARSAALNSGFSSGAGGNGGDHPSWDESCTSPFTINAAGLYGGYGGKGGSTYGCSYQQPPTAGGDGSGTSGSYGGGITGIAAGGGRGGYYGGGGGGGGAFCDCGGGGGGGPAIVMNSSSTALFIASGGGGGGSGGGCSSTGAGGGGGGGPEGGGGGQGGGYSSCTSNGGGAGVGGGHDGLGCGTCSNTGNTSGQCAPGGTNYNGGGGGGGALHGTSGKSHTPDSTPAEGGRVDTVFGYKYCNGGATSSHGKPGAIRISWENTNNALKCKYNTLSNGGSGGGGGQVWIGEIEVTEGEYLNFHIGNGGYKQNNYSSNGNNGGNTYITRQSGTVIQSVQGGGGGVYTASLTISGLDMLGQGKGINGNNWYDWTGIYPDGGGVTGGLNSDYGKTIAQGSSGGKGGGVYFKDGALADGGNAGNAQSNGGDGVNYGTGGGGGGGVTNNGSFPGLGGAGAPGYIYIEWGDSNGGGGSSGEIIEEKKIVSAVAGAKLEIIIGEGGKGSDIEYDSETKYKPGKKGGDGIDTIVKIKGKSYSAKGGVGGDGGGLNKGEHGKGGVLEGLTGSSVSFGGEKGIDNYGGTGGTAIYKAAASGDGMGGCGGNMIAGKCFSPSETPYGKDGAKAGSGGGGGAVKDSTPYKGGNGGDGMVIVEWEEPMG